VTRYVLGLNAYHGDAAAVLLADGQVVMAVEEERLNRRKHCAGFPGLAARACLQASSVTPAELASVAISRQPRANLYRKVLFSLGKLVSGRGLGRVKDRLANAARIRDVQMALARALECDVEVLPALQRVEHHRAHLASAYHASGWDDAALLSIDGFGDFVSTMLGWGHGGVIEVLDQVEFPHSLGILYTATTQFLGFPHYGDEGKVMGLAAYGEPAYREEFRDLITLTPGGFRLGLDYFQHHTSGVAMTWEEGSPEVGRVWSDRWVERFGPAREPDAELTRREQDLAATVQQVLEEAYVHLLEELHRRTGCRRLCLAGGVAYNSVANGKIIDRTPFDDVYILCAAGDSGTALGAAYAAHQQLPGAERPPPLPGAYLGPAFTDAEIARALQRAGLRAPRLGDDELLERTAAAIAVGQVVGWFQGAMEFGPRALGNRSIVVDPRHPGMQDILNARIKHREPFRPFAPSVPVERVGDYFGASYPSPDMLMVYEVRPEHRARLPAITHVDGTGRLQTVSREANPRYHALLRAFERVAGVPIVLNTSFNENEPIVCTPEEAIDCYRKTGMDVLVLGNRFLEGR
jgi:carbamoyltransferase